jgi:hypothetical protein
VTAKPNDAWEFWQKSKTALDELNELLQVFATAIAQDDPSLQLPPHTVKQVKRALARFQENFILLVREQKRKAGL